MNGITFAWFPTLHSLAFNGASTVANYQALLQTVAFESTSDNPTDFDGNPQRTLTWAVSDGTTVTTATTTIDIVAVNDASDLTAAATAVYTENDPPLTVSPGASVTDVDDLSLIAGAVRIADGAFDGDILSVNGLQTGSFLSINFSYNALLHTLTFTRPASIADYQAFVEAVQFSSTSDDPTNGGINPTRTLALGLVRRRRDQLRAHDTIQVIPVDDPAVAQNDALTTTEDTAITTGNVSRRQRPGPRRRPRQCVLGDGGVGRHARHPVRAAVGRAADAQRRRHVQLRSQPSVRLSADIRLGRVRPHHDRYVHLHHHRAAIPRP